MTEQSQTVGDNAIAVQLTGDGNTITMTVRDTPFAHSQLHLRKAPPANINGLLRTDLRGTSLVGREQELRILAAWRASPSTISVRCVIGGAGAGKTRLAIEACEEAEREGWFATFAPSSELKRFHDAQNLVHWKFPRDALIVIDYAATSQAVLLDWFATLAPHRGAAGHKLRILLLERHASAETGWWAELSRPSSLDRDSAADLIDENFPLELPTLDAISDRRALLAEVMEKAALLFEPARPHIQPPMLGSDPSFDKRLAENRPENEPLYLIMAGIHAVHEGAPAALALNRLELANRIAWIEKNRLSKFGQSHGFGQNDRFLAHVAACLTLQNGCSVDELAALVQEEQEALKIPAATLDSEQIARIMINFLPSSHGNVAPLRPDLIGECFVLLIIGGDVVRNETVQVNIVLRAWRRKPIDVLDTLIRTACDFAHGDSSHVSVRWLRALVERINDLGELNRIAGRVPYQTLALRDFAVDVEMRVAAALTPLAQQNPSRFLAVLSEVLNNLAIRLSQIGRWEQAFEAAEKAVAIYRRLDEAPLYSFTPQLAMSLNNMANYLSAIGQRGKALIAVEEAVVLFRQLATARPTDFKPDLAKSLKNLSIYLNEMGYWERALAAADDAVALHRELVDEDPDTFTPDFAASLASLANCLSPFGERRKDAFEAAERALELYRDLFASRPDAFRPDLAKSLHNLANRLGDLGQLDQALAAAQEAVELRRPLAKAHPDPFTPDLADSLSNLAIRYGELGGQENALKAAEEAVALYRKLVKAQAEAFTPKLGMSLNILNRFINNPDRRLELAEEVVELYRQLFASLPNAYEPDLAMSLSNAAQCMGSTGHRTKALATAEEAVGRFRKLATASPDVYTPQLAVSIFVLSEQLDANGQVAAAMSRNREAVFILAPYCLGNPFAFGSQMTVFVDAYRRRANAMGTGIDEVLVSGIMTALKDAGFSGRHK